MATPLCSYCRCALERIEVANGGAVVVCLICDEIGNADEVAAGARLRPAAQFKRRPLGTRRSPRAR
jgi:hypothetical protein